MSSSTHPPNGGPDPPDQRLSRGAAGAGVSSGTLLAALADNLPDDSPYKSWLVILAPSLSIVVGFGWGLVKFHLDELVSYWRVQRALADSIKRNDAIIADPNETEEEKEAARKDNASLRKLARAENRKRLRARIKDN